MHRLASSFVLGFRGCDRVVGERLLGGEAFEPSRNDYDWLGPGIYFWEANPERGLEFAAEAARRRRSATVPFVVGAVIDLGLCLDLTTSLGVKALQAAHEDFKAFTAAGDLALPRNSADPDKLRRNLDCAVIRWLHASRTERGEPPIQSVRGIFTEGPPAYPGSGFAARTHVQLAVTDPAGIKGVFRVR